MQFKSLNKTQLSALAEISRLVWVTTCLTHDEEYVGDETISYEKEMMENNQYLTLQGLLRSLNEKNPWFYVEVSGMHIPLNRLLDGWEAYQIDAASRLRAAWEAYFSAKYSVGSDYLLRHYEMPDEQEFKSLRAQILDLLAEAKGCVIEDDRLGGFVPRWAA